MVPRKRRIVGRERERKVLESAATSPEAELIAIYGRRRVGKTFLVREHFADDLCFELTGMYGVPLAKQLRNFAEALEPSPAQGLRPVVPRDWIEAFTQLTSLLERLPRRGRKRVVFLDELPWLASRRSGFVPAFEHFWNSWASRRADLIVVVAGSAASWMVDHMVRARGGLHHRVTRQLRLDPFTLSEARGFLASQGVTLENYQTMELYMALGGIPHYLKEVSRGESPAQCIDRVCFSRDGLLHQELTHIYASLFDDAERHQLVVRALSSRRQGLSRTELLAATKLPTGGWVSNVLEDLEASGFVMRTPRFGLAKKDQLYRLSDEYSLFHLRWIEHHRGRAAGTWQRARGTPAWRAWSGYAFESVCLKHVDALRWALGIGAVQTEESTWRHAGRGEDGGAQIDLVIDRKDGCINLCELKFAEGEFVIDRAYARTLREKREVFRRVTRTKKTLFTTLVTSHGIAENDHSREIVDASVTMDALFDR